jgi:DNA-directed RNA polymerase subunit H (RpoH/RPB5)
MFHFIILHIFFTIEKSYQDTGKVLKMNSPSYQTCLEMLQQRGYEITEKDDSTRILAIKPDGNPMVVFFTDVPKFNVKNVQVYISVMNDMDIFHAIIVYKDSVTSFTRKAVSKSLEMKLELFAEEDLQYNITKHRLQPSFEKLPSDEAEKFKQKYGNKFGVIKKDDPIARFYGYDRGDVIRVTRGKVNKFVTYRLVRG